MGAFYVIGAAAIGFYAAFILVCGLALAASAFMIRPK